MFQNNIKPVLLAPMAGVFDYPCRRLYRELFPELYTVTELLSSRGLSLGDRKTLRMAPADEPRTSIQLFGNEARYFFKAVEILRDSGRTNPIDINAGCSVKKVVKAGGGSKLMESPETLVEIVKGITGKFKVPVSVKLRLGFKAVTVIELGKQLADAGAAFLTLHPRLGTDTFASPVPWDYIRKLKQVVSIPVIGNGNITDAASARAIIAETGCDGIMVGRAAMGKPSLPYIMYAAINNLEPPESVTLSRQLEYMMTLFDYYLASYPEYLACVQMRKHLCWGISHFKGAKAIRADIMNAKTPSDLLHLIDRLQQYSYL